MAALFGAHPVSLLLLAACPGVEHGAIEVESDDVLRQDGGESFGVLVGLDGSQTTLLVECCLSSGLFLFGERRQFRANHVIFAGEHLIEIDRSQGGGVTSLLTTTHLPQRAPFRPAQGDGMKCSASL